MHYFFFQCSKVTWRMKLIEVFDHKHNESRWFFGPWWIFPQFRKEGLFSSFVILVSFKLNIPNVHSLILFTSVTFKKLWLTTDVIRGEKSITTYPFRFLNLFPALKLHTQVDQTIFQHHENFTEWRLTFFIQHLTPLQCRNIQRDERQARSYQALNDFLNWIINDKELRERSKMA